MSNDILAHMPHLYAFSRKLCGNRVDAEDLVQQTLLRAIENERRFTPGSYRRAWLRKIMRNAFLNNRRKEVREVTGGEDCVSSAPSSPPAQEWSLLQKELARNLSALPTHYRDAIILVGLQGESYLHAASALHCDIGTIKSRVNRARSMLRDAVS